MKQWYESLFDNYANKYDQECFVQGTAGECDFIEQEIGWNKSLRIIDIGCGTSRHSIELTKRGYSLIGVDLSESQLVRAREKAKEAGLRIDFQKHDARNLPFKNEFDLAIMLCEGGFPLMETDEMNFEILRNATQVLKEDGKLIFTTLNWEVCCGKRGKVGDGPRILRARSAAYLYELSRQRGAAAQHRRQRLLGITAPRFSIQSGEHEA